MATLDTCYIVLNSHVRSVVTCISQAISAVWYLNMQRLLVCHSCKAHVIFINCSYLSILHAWKTTTIYVNSPHEMPDLLLSTKNMRNDTLTELVDMYIFQSLHKTPYITWIKHDSIVNEYVPQKSLSKSIDIFVWFFDCQWFSN